MSTLAHTLRREIRVMFSLKVQSLRVRILKWAVMLALIVRYHDKAWFWPVAAITFSLSLGVHFLYRCKTCAWTRPWGGWRDLDAGRL